MKRACVVGLGYIGLPTAITAAQAGIEVVGFDIDAERVTRIQQYDPVIEEPEVGPRLAQVLRSGTLMVQTEPAAADHFVIAVPTPFTADKKADVTYVFSAVRALAPVLQPGNTVILESTVPVGTTAAVAQLLEELTGMVVGIDLFVAFCPERVLPGKIFYELVHNDRVIGGITPLCAQQAATFYAPFVRGTLTTTKAHAAEMTKLIENSFRDVNIAFAHEVAAMAQACNLDPYEVIALANRHPRVNILQPTCGVGGHCLAVDPWFLVESFPEQTRLIKTAREVNDARPQAVIAATVDAVDTWRLQHPDRACTVLVCGVTYKPDVDDIRESPALTIAQRLSAACVASGDTLLVCEPYVTLERKNLVPGSHQVTLRDGLARADVVLFTVAHGQFKTCDSQALTGKVVLDYCGATL